jgi:hypothetical protein
MHRFHFSKSFLPAFIILFPLLSQILNAQAATDRFLLWHPSAASTAMGGIGTTLSGSGFAAYYNPAGLTGITSSVLGASITKPDPFFGSTAHSFVGLAIPFGGGRYTLGISANMIWKSIGAVTWFDPNPVAADPSTFNWHGKISFAGFVNQHLSIGAGFGILRSALADFDVQGQGRTGTSTSIAGDVGLQWRILHFGTMKCGGLVYGHDTVDTTEQYHLEDKGVTIGVAIRNIGPKITFIDQAQADNLPELLSYGIRYKNLINDFVSATGAVEAEQELNESSSVSYLHFGAEVVVLNMVALRAGYFLDTYGPKNSYGAIGGGIHYSSFTFNLSRVTQFYLPTWQFDISIDSEGWL